MSQRIAPAPAEQLAEPEALEQPTPVAPALSLEDLIPDAPAQEPAPAPLRTPAPTVPALRSARLVALSGTRASIAWRGRTEPFDAEIAPEVEKALLELALRNQDGVLVEVAEGQQPVIVGVLQTRVARELHVEAEKIHLEAAREVVLRAGRAAIRLREDGDVEIVGSRVSAASRGLFRIVGRILRLN